MHGGVVVPAFETTLPHWVLLFLAVGVLGVLLVSGVVGGNYLLSYWFGE
ncbi:hypothetical protein SAMN04487950_1961 [Halogranum rubrum]|uniref:Uncharacterized protein n=1 Tax=Halogranum rubrum TaxID=553466 RepID=A0A1I4E8M6_9EURY|nr:hypothetical protein [Halogranum rubrum]SFL01633.1 hypothetical protein SAMN04487950_1961 [Halogranum rubrum]